MRDEDKLILHLCADMGSDSKPYRDAGYRVQCIGKDIGVENFSVTEPVYGIIANPVCTNFSRAPGNVENRDMSGGLSILSHCCRIIYEALCANQLRFHVIENPATGRLKEILGKPKYSYEPWWFGDPWTKKTALWGHFYDPKRVHYEWEYVPKNPHLYIRPGRGKPSIAFLHKSAKEHIESFREFKTPDDASFRSLCPQGFAKAFFDANR